MTDLNELAPAFVAFQASLNPVEKSAVNPFFSSKYAPLPEVRAALQPKLAAHGLALSCLPAVVEGENGLRFVLLHESGQYLDGYWKLTPAKRDPQGEGSDTTYKRRYGEMAITGAVVDEDDDGNAASAQPKKSRRPNPLADAKAELKAAMTKAGLSNAQKADYAWVADATDTDVDSILATARLLEMGKVEA